MDPLVNKVVSRYKMARGPVEPNVARNAKAMLEEMQAAEASLHRAVQFSRRLQTERSMEWIVEQLGELHSNFSEFLKNADDALDYITKE